MGLSYTWYNFKKCYTTQYFLIGCEFQQIHRWTNYLHIFSMLAKFQGDQKLIVMSSINCFLLRKTQNHFLLLIIHIYLHLSSYSIRPTLFVLFEKSNFLREHHLLSCLLFKNV